MPRERVRPIDELSIRRIHHAGRHETVADPLSMLGNGNGVRPRHEHKPKPEERQGEEPCDTGPGEQEEQPWKQRERRDNRVNHPAASTAGK